MSSGSLEIHLLGGFRVLVDGAAVDESRWVRKKAKTLIKLLALEPLHELTRDRLTELLWPEFEPEQALNNFHKTLHAARRTLEPDLRAGAESRFLITAEQRIALRATPLEIDLEIFERKARSALATGEGAAEALAVFAGELLPEDRHEDWASIPREQASNLQQELILRLAQQREADGDVRGAIDLLDRAVASQPVNENAHRELMRLHAAQGNRHLALNQYRLCAEALRRELDTEPEAATVRLYEQVQEGQVGLDPARQTRPPVNAAKREAPSRRWIFVGIAGAAGAAAATVWWPRRRQAKRIPSLAVMPFALAGGAPIEHVSDGLTESLIDSLSQLPDLRVMARSTVFAYRNKSGSNSAIDPRELGRAVGVAAVLTGRVGRRESRLDVNVELVDAADGAHIWGRQYACDAAETPFLHSRIASDVAGALAYRLQEDDERKLARKGTSDPRAHELYLLGRYHWNKRTEAGFRKAIEQFEQATSVDPKYAAAYAGLADCYGLLAFSDAPGADYFPKARAMAERALALDPDLAEGHTSRAMVKALYDWDWPQAEASFRHAIELNPGLATAHHWYAVHLNAHGRVSEAKDEFARALALDPLSRIILTNSGYVAHYQRDYAGAIQTYRKALELDPNFPAAHQDLTLAYEQSGQLELAAHHAAQALRLDGETAVAARFEAAVRSGGYRAGLTEIQRHMEQKAKTGYISPTALAQIAIRRGEKEEAFRWLDKAVSERNSPLAYLKANPVYDPLRADPRFPRLLQRIERK